MNLKDIIFTPNHTEAQLSQAVTWLQDDKVKKQYAYAANFAIICSNDNYLAEFINQPCHREIQGNRFTDRSLVATECGWGRRHPSLGAVSEELFQPFFDWLTKESFASRFILWSSIKDGFVVSADMFTPMLQNIMIITRHFYEVHENGFINFNKMLKDGVPGDIAYPLAFNSSLSTIALPQAKFTSVYGHRVTHLFGLNEFKQWLTGELGETVKDGVNSPQEHYRVRNNYLGGKELFWNKEVQGYSQVFYQALVRDLMELKEFRDGLSNLRKTNNKEMYRAPNPFAPKPAGHSLPAADEISNEEALNFVAPFLTDLLKPYWNRT